MTDLQAIRQRIDVSQPKMTLEGHRLAEIKQVDLPKLQVLQCCSEQREPRVLTRWQVAHEA